MRLLLWAVVAYEAVVGLSELTWVSTGNTTLASVAQYPSLASITVDPFFGSSANGNVIDGSADLIFALLIWLLFLR